MMPTRCDQATATAVRWRECWLNLPMVFSPGQSTHDVPAAGRDVPSAKRVPTVTTAMLPISDQRLSRRSPQRDKRMSAVAVVSRKFGWAIVNKPRA